MEQSLEREIQRSVHQKLPLGIILLHVDRVEDFYDQFGHAAGDYLLREIGVFLPSHIRTSDIACRYAAQEFLILLPETSLEMTQQQAEQLRQNIKQLHFTYQGQALGLMTISGGVASISEHGVTAKALLRAAHAALNRAIEQGCDRVETLAY